MRQSHTARRQHEGRSESERSHGVCEYHRLHFVLRPLYFSRGHLHLFHDHPIILRVLWMEMVGALHTHSEVAVVCVLSAAATCLGGLGEEKQARAA